MHLICIMEIKLTILVILMFKKIKSEKIQGFSQLQTQQSTKPRPHLEAEFRSIFLQAGPLRCQILFALKHGVDLEKYF